MGFVPEAVVLQVGGNDQRWITNQIMEENFVRAYVAFLTELTERHANTHLPIFVIIGPKPHLVTDPLTLDAVTRARSSGLDGVNFLNATGTQMDGCQNHPGRKGHREIFNMLHEAMAEVLG